MEPAIGLLELASVARGIRAGDAMVKRSPVDVLFAGTVHPGKYLLLVGGDVASVEEALDAGRREAGPLIDELFLPEVDRQVVAALRGTRRADSAGEAIGIVETGTVAATLLAADRGVKGADVVLREVHLADDLGGKAYCLFQGLLSDVEAAVDHACAALPEPRQLLECVVIPRIHDEMRASLDAAPAFFTQLRRGA